MRDGNEVERGGWDSELPVHLSSTKHVIHVAEVAAGQDHRIKTTQRAPQCAVH